MNKEFPISSFLSRLLKTVGFLLLVIGIYFALYQGITESMIGKHGFSGGDVMELGGGMAALFFGMLSMLIAETVKVMLAIELNTRNGQQEELDMQNNDEGLTAEME